MSRSSIFPAKLNWLQVVLVLLVLGALYVFVDLSRNTETRRRLEMVEATFSAESQRESTRQVELEATLAYVQGTGYPDEVLHSETGLLAEGESAILPNIILATAEPAPLPPPTPDPLLQARPWQMWWRLLTDAPMPTRR